MDVRPLTPDDVPDTMDLVRQAGWNQVPADWRRLLDVEPAGCFTATSTATSLRPRRCSRTTERIPRLARAVTAQSRLTSVGSGWYWSTRTIGGTGTAAKSSIASRATRTAEVVRDRFDDVCAFDRRACGVDRSDLLRRLLDSSGVTGVGIRDAEGDGIRGYAVSRPGREFGQVGPLIASSPRDAARATEPLEQNVVLINLLAVDAVATRLERLGMERQRRLTRMTAPEPNRLLVGPDIVAAAGLELG